ncbi:MAG TPA: hypothetical protein VI702_02460 [Nitrospiria bacterium]
MKFDTAIAAQKAFKRVPLTGELGEDLDSAIEAEERFGSSTGSDATEAYEALVQIGEGHPEAASFLEFLIYSTWNHVLDDPSPDRFEKGLALCNRFLKKAGGQTDSIQRQQIQELRQSFLQGLGRSEDEGIEEYDEDAFAGGD